jgi:hypothetical protein
MNNYAINITQIQIKDVTPIIAIPFFTTLTVAVAAIEM